MHLWPFILLFFFFIITLIGLFTYRHANGSVLCYKSHLLWKLKYFVYCFFKRYGDKKFFCYMLKLFDTTNCCLFIYYDISSLIFLLLNTGWYWPFQLGIYTKCVSDTSYFIFSYKGFSWCIFSGFIYLVQTRSFFIHRMTYYEWRIHGPYSKQSKDSM